MKRTSARPQAPRAAGAAPGRAAGARSDWSRFGQPLAPANMPVPGTCVYRLCPRDGQPTAAHGPARRAFQAVSGLSDRPPHGNSPSKICHQTLVASHWNWAPAECHHPERLDAFAQTVPVTRTLVSHPSAGSKWKSRQIRNPPPLKDVWLKRRAETSLPKVETQFPAQENQALLNSVIEQATLFPTFYFSSRPPPAFLC